MGSYPSEDPHQMIMTYRLFSQYKKRIVCTQVLQLSEDPLLSELLSLIPVLCAYAFYHLPLLQTILFTWSAPATGGSSFSPYQSPLQDSYILPSAVLGSVLDVYIYCSLPSLSLISCYLSVLCQGIILR